jgi:hypothetical protein
MWEYVKHIYAGYVNRIQIDAGWETVIYVGGDTVHEGKRVDEQSDYQLKITLGPFNTRTWGTVGVTCSQISFKCEEMVLNTANIL